MTNSEWLSSLRPGDGLVSHPMMLLKAVQSGRLQSPRVVTHRLALDDIMRAYDTFERGEGERALKVTLSIDARG